MIEFTNEEVAYETWVKSHRRDGFVLNTWPEGRRKKEQTMHEASCNHIDDFGKLLYTSKGRPKLCGVNLDELLAEAKRRGPVVPCPDCNTF
jgi:hypothetical protein